ncbi:hypothetical protein [Burkholderia plantarii]|uniref:hypothetical protein n=1 Tax=Burkholderia plantarii TaxID=41899 RepID=UPI0006D8D233|nr:hypothetical protein [Burkholderia plantarii]ALK30844.1 hypothetical protein bpln_1g20560 [Burkholderia plantarii]GLZ19474.1 hypothetical protein Bpla01_30040 [Burkholderia plantarii]
MALASSLTLYSATSLNDAMAMPPSVVRAFFGGKPFEIWKQAREAEQKTQAAIVSRLNDVIRATGVVAKLMAKTR